VKALLAALLTMIAAAAHADLYRWIDPQSGSVKYSSVPPPSSQAGVQVIPYRASPAPAQPDAPAPAAAQPGNAALELRWRELLAEISAAAPGSPTLQQRLPDLAAVASELDRVDPAGTARRQAETQAALQRLLKGER
jgi:hypothetical protein